MTSSKKRSPPPRAEGDEDETACCVCFDEATEQRKCYFPCAHWVCDTCYPRCSVCPVCRMDRSGVSGQERREVAEASADEVQRARAIFDASIMTPRVVVYQGGEVDGPFAEGNTTVSTTALSRPTTAALPELFNRGFFRILNQRRRPPPRAPRGGPAAVLAAVADAARREVEEEGGH